nr:hypothetical protein [Tanacetum cinerariifolium]
MGDKHLSSILETESDEVIKSSVENLVSIPSESKVTSDNASECDVPVNDESSLNFTTFSNPLFDCNNDFTSSDDKSLSNKDILMIYSNSLFDDEEIIPTKIDPHYFNAETNLLESFLNRDTLIDSFPKFDYLFKKFSGELAHIDPVSPGIKEADFDLEEEIRLVENLLYDNSSPRSSKELHVENIDTVVESLSPSHILVEDKGNIYFLEKLLSDDHLPLPENESSNFDHHDDPSFPRPPPEPPDVEIFFDFEPDAGVLTTKVVEDISEHYVLMPKVLPTIPTLCPNTETLLPFSSENEDKVFKPCILSYIPVSHRDKITSDFFKNPMMMIALDLEDSRARGFVHHAADSGPIFDAKPLQKKEAQIKLYKTWEDKELDKVIELENKVKVLDNIVNKTGQSVQTMNMLNINVERVLQNLSSSRKLKERILVSDSKDRLPMLAPGNYVQWKSRINRYIDTKPNHELIHYCLKNPPYELGWIDKEIRISKGSPITRSERFQETYKNVSQEIRDQLNAKAEAVQIILTGIDNDIYSTVDACPNACEMWKAIERLKQGKSINVQDLETNLY